MSYDMDDINLSSQELQVLSELDSRQFGFLKLKHPENAKKKGIVLKAVKYLEKMLVQVQNQKEEEKTKPEEGQEVVADGTEDKSISIDPKTYCKLGHFHLLLEDFSKAMSAYQKFFKLEPDNWRDPQFVYGLGLCYYHFNAYQWIRFICGLKVTPELTSSFIIFTFCANGASALLFFVLWFALSVDASRKGHLM